jgi:hypothetical protein
MPLFVDVLGRKRSGRRWRRRRHKALQFREIQGLMLEGDRLCASHEALKFIPKSKVLVSEPLVLNFQLPELVVFPRASTGERSADVDKKARYEHAQRERANEWKSPDYESLDPHVNIPLNINPRYDVECAFVANGPGLYLKLGCTRAQNFCLALAQD